MALRVTLYDIKRNKLNPEAKKVHLGLPKDPRI